MKAKKDTKDLLNKVIVLGSSLVYLGKGVTDDLVSELEKRKVLSGDEGKNLAQKIRKQVHHHKEKVKNDVVTQLKGIIDELGIATKDDLKKSTSTNSSKKGAVKTSTKKS